MSQEYYYRKQIIEIFQCEEEFLHVLEEEQLVHSVEPSPGAERVFPQDQVERIRVIHNLVRDLDVNIPGVEVIMEMCENMIRMQRQFDSILEALVEELKGKIAR